MGPFVSLIQADVFYQIIFPIVIQIRVLVPIAAGGIIEYIVKMIFLIQIVIKNWKAIIL